MGLAVGCSRARLFTPCLLALVLGACEEGGSATRGRIDRVDGVDPSEALFAPEHLIEVEIEIAESDWEALRIEGRSLPHAVGGCADADFAYTYFPATVTVDGQRYEDVAVRKKGYLGSLSALRPSLKLNFGKYEQVAGRRHAGMKRMTLNNDRQDPSHTHQCMSYALFRQAGLAAPRCNHAHVVVNGVDMGIYSHVESLKKPFLRRNFGSDAGNLYEGNAQADFTPQLQQRYERKTNRLDAQGQPAPRDDLAAVVQALEAEDEALYQTLDGLVDLDAFMSFWAMEVMCGHWDGYTGDRNNHYVYFDPSDGKLRFIPWGTDGTFEEGHLFLPSIPDSVYAHSVLANRLYRIETTREMYRARLRQLVDSLWDEAALLAEVDRIGALTSADAEALDEQRAFVSARRQQLLAELDADAPIWPYGFYGGLSTCPAPHPISGTFQAVWGEPWDIVESPATSLDLDLNTFVLPFVFQGAAAGPTDGLASINFFVTPTSGKNHVVTLRLPMEQLRQGEVHFHGFETLGVLSREDWPGMWVQIAVIGGGSIVLTSAGSNVGDPVEGSFTGFFRE